MCGQSETGIWFSDPKKIRMTTQMDGRDDIKRLYTFVQPFSFHTMELYDNDRIDV